MESFIEIIKQIGVGIATIFLACPIFLLFFIEYIERWDEKKKHKQNKSTNITKSNRQKIEESKQRTLKLQQEIDEKKQNIEKIRKEREEIRKKRLAIEEEIARIDSFTRSIKGATNHEYIKEQQKMHFPDKFN